MQTHFHHVVGHQMLKVEKDGNSIGKEEQGEKQVAPQFGQEEKQYQMQQAESQRQRCEGHLNANAKEILARNLFLHRKKTFQRKIQEALLALEIERQYTKEEILRFYCDQVYMGHGRYGLEAASRFYFDRPARELTLDQAATAIRDMWVRGAPLIGATAAYGLALALRDDPGDANLERAVATLMATRPTAVNLRWALNDLKARLGPVPPRERAALAYARAAEICDEDVAINRAIGEHGAPSQAIVGGGGFLE